MPVTRKSRVPSIRAKALALSSGTLVVVGRSDDRSVGDGEGQGYVRLELGGVVVLAIGLVAPVADGFGGGRGQEGISA